MRESAIDFKRALALAGLVIVGGCAVQTAPNGQIQVHIDHAEVLGQSIGSFTLGNGSEGNLRVLTLDSRRPSQYSIKLQKYLKVIPIENAKWVRLVSASQIGDRTLVVLEKSEPYCNYKTQLMSIKEAEVLTWDLGDCLARPRIDMSPEAATFDYVQSHRTTRFTYRDGRLARGELAPSQPVSVAKPGLPAGAIDPDAPRHVPGLPTAAQGPAESSIKAPPKVAVAAPPTERRAAPAKPAKALEFPSQEQKPIRIVLDK